MTHLTIEAAGAQVYYERQGTGCDVLLLHGWGGRCESWAPVLRDFAQKYAMTALDFPGQGGRSSDPPQPWDVTDYMEMTRQLLDRLGIERTHIVAHSFGGRVALALAATYPQRVNRMVLTGVPALKKPPTAKQRARSACYKGLKALGDNALSRAVWGREVVEGWRNRLQEKFGSADYRALSPQMRKTFSRVVSQDLSPYLEKVQAPTLLFWGEQDTAAPLWVAQAMEKRMPDAGLVAMPGVGHFAYLDRYADFRAVLDNFIS